MRKSIVLLVIISLLVVGCSASNEGNTPIEEGIAIEEDIDEAIKDEEEVKEEDEEINEEITEDEEKAVVVEEPKDEEEAGQRTDKKQDKAAQDNATSKNEPTKKSPDSSNAKKAPALNQKESPAPKPNNTSGEQSEIDRIRSKYPTAAGKEINIFTKEYREGLYNIVEIITTEIIRDKDGNVLSEEVVDVDITKTKIAEELEFKPASTLAGEYKRVVGDKKVESSLEKAVIEELNKSRIEEGMSPLKANKELTQLARIKSADLFLYQYFAHTSPNYGQFHEIFNRYGIPYSAVGENLQKTPEKSAIKIHQNFMNSPSHRENMMNPLYEEVGVGIINFGGTYYITQLFRKN